MNGSVDSPRPSGEVELSGAGEGAPRELSLTFEIGRCALTRSIARDLSRRERLLLSRTPVLPHSRTPALPYSRTTHHSPLTTHHSRLLLFPHPASGDADDK